MIHHLEFIRSAQCDLKGSKVLFNIVNSREQIGFVFWSDSWHCFVSELFGGIMVSSDCHRQIADFLDSLKNLFEVDRNG